MINFTLRQVEIFLAVAKTLNMSKAAQELNMTQAAVSMAISEFEKFLSQKLFERISNKLFLNENGRSLIPKAVAIYDMAKEIDRTVWPKTIRVSSSSTIGNYILPVRLGEYLKKFNDCFVSLTVGNTDQVIKDILSFEADVGFIEGPCTDPDIRSEVFSRDNLYIFCSLTNPLSKIKNVDTKRLLACNWILREKGSGTREVIENALKDNLALMNISMELGHSEAIKNAVMSDLGISCLSEVVLKNYIDFGLICLVDTEMNPITRDLYIILHKEKYLSSVLKQFIDFIRL
jgi:DNA-binding transcriptional LysR family regulator